MLFRSIHGLVYFRDGSVVAQLGSADMRTSISYALAWPGRLPWENQALDLVSMQKLEFRDIDTKRFPCFVLARQALVEGDVQPAVLNAANEIAVEAFLQRRIGFDNIASVVEDCLSMDLPGDLSSLSAVLDIDADARRLATVSLAKRQLL